MPRIRSLKPEHKQHRKVGPLSDRAYRLWIGLLTEADDEGRGVAEPEQLRVQVFGYHPKVTAASLSQALEDCARLGLITLYEVAGVLYYQFPSWSDHQRVDHPRPSSFPPPNGDSTKVRRSLASPREAARSLAPDPIRSEGNGREGTSSSSAPPTPATPREAPTSLPEWPSPEALMKLYNDGTPDTLTSAESLSPARAKKCREYLAMFPEREWWVEVMRQIHASAFLQGKRPSKGHEKFKATFDWLLSKGKADGIENAVKVHDGQYHDGQGR